MIKATVTNDGQVKILNTEKGMTVMKILLDAGIFIDAPCGGCGHCGKCKVKVSGFLSPPSKTETELLSPALIEKGYRLACRAVAEGDITITAPDIAKVMIETGGTIQSCAFAPSVTVTAADKRFEVDFCGTEIDSFDTAAPVLGMALDIGTTTLAAHFFNLETGRNLGTQTALNPQRQYGADVISRIAACESDENGTKKLCSVLNDTVLEMAENFCKHIGAATSSIYHCTVAGNTVMQHIAAGLSPEGMARSPFESVTLFGCEMPAESSGISLCRNASHAMHIYYSPCVSAFVGGDITAGLLSCEFDRLQKPSLFIDIGTNGEMALLCRDGILCCSTAAGPAFEGAHITCGTGSVSGAINHVTALNDSTNADSVTYGTINGTPAIGICGSGLVDAIAVLLGLGLIDETGTLDTGFKSNKYGSYFPIGKSGVFITQKDVREVQLAKSAIASGIESLLDSAGLKPQNISQVFVSGGFGTCIDIKNACRIGLLPKEFLPVTVTAGNSSLAGASMLLLDRHSFDRIESIAQKCHLVELAGNTFFQRRFVENMLFDC